ncbi:MAG TPA: hypothetical protein VK632_15495 [Verrucomicrobiae bacterium]|nr:hypothetical protein [Verrucomicrobiae bacterium]
MPGHQPAADAEFGTNDNLANVVELYEKSHIERTLGKTGGRQDPRRWYPWAQPLDALPQNRKLGD